MGRAQNRRTCFIVRNVFRLLKVTSSHTHVVCRWPFFAACTRELGENTRSNPTFLRAWPAQKWICRLDAICQLSFVVTLQICWEICKGIVGAVILPPKHFPHFVIEGKTSSEFTVTFVTYGGKSHIYQHFVCYTTLNSATLEIDVRIITGWAYNESCLMYCRLQLRPSLRLLLLLCVENRTSKTVSRKLAEN